MCLWHIIWSKGNEIYSRDSFISPFLAFCSHLLLSPTAELGGQRERECVQFTAWEKELSWETTNRKRDTSITSTQPHTHTHTHTQSTLLARSNNGCFLTTGVTVSDALCESSRKPVNKERAKVLLNVQPPSVRDWRSDSSTVSSPSPHHPHTLSKHFTKGGFSWPVCCLWMQHDSVF